MKRNYLQQVDNSVIFVGDYMELYIPEYYYEIGVAIDKGNIVEFIGLVNFKVFKSPTDSDGILETLNFPSMMSTKPNSMLSKEIEVVKGSGVTKTRILKYYNGDTVMLTTSVVQSVENCEMFIKLLNAGKIPNTIPYENVFHLFLKNLEINNMNLNVSAVLLETIVSEMYRGKGKLDTPFRKIVGKNPATSQLDYEALNMRDLCSFNSTFNAVTFEDLDSMLMTSINRERYGKNNTYSPIENILKY